MRIAGIVAEYNPFHNGHTYHIAQTKARTEADYVIVVMSGSFVQRGTCAITDKYTRAESALRAGADLVLELPALFATSSAEFFASGAIRTLSQTGIVTHLGFGCETTNTDALMQAAQILLEEPNGYKALLQHALSQGYTFPGARDYALRKYCPTLYHSLKLDQPNCILALEYCKSILRSKCTITPVPILREGSGYHDTTFDPFYSSAASIRKHISMHTDIAKILSTIKPHLPAETVSLLADAHQKTFPIIEDDMSSFLLYALLCEKECDYTSYLDVSEALSNRISKHLFDYETFTQFASLLKTKESTYTRICRCLTHIMLNIKKADMPSLTEPLPYIRVLGVRKESTHLLQAIASHSNGTLITNPAKQRAALSPAAASLLEQDLYATQLYSAIAAQKFHHTMDNELSIPFLKV